MKKLEPFNYGKTDVDKLICRYIDAIGMLKFGSFTEVSKTLDQIPNLAKRLLALRGYLRKESQGVGTVKSRWAFSQQEFDDFKKTAAGAALDREISLVKRRFSELTEKKYRLGTGDEFRPHLTQLGYWNERTNIQPIADQLLKKAQQRVKQKMAEFVSPSNVPFYPPITDYNDRFQLQFQVAIRPSLIARNPNADGVAEKDAVFTQLQVALDDFALFLQKAYLTGSLKTATPGISDHGRSQAIDFGVREVATNKKIVGAGSAATWRSTGMADYLAEAMKSSKHFKGPLKRPDEPWHWEFHA